MRRPLAFLLLGFLATTSEAEIQSGVQSTPAGLPKEIVPRSYLIYLEPDIEARVIDGVESIEIEVLEPTNRIVLNALNTQITRARIEIDRQAEELSPQLDANRQTVSFDLENQLPPGNYTLSIKFQSTDPRRAARTVYPIVRRGAGHRRAPAGDRVSDS